MLAIKKRLARDRKVPASNMEDHINGAKAGHSPQECCYIQPWGSHSAIAAHPKCNNGFGGGTRSQNEGLTIGEAGEQGSMTVTMHIWRVPNDISPQRGSPNGPKSSRGSPDQ